MIADAMAKALSTTNCEHICHKPSHEGAVIGPKRRFVFICTFLRGRWKWCDLFGGASGLHDRMHVDKVQNRSL